ncbi:MAG: LmeA family phospholipid-binding protein [Trebonia sp.]
MSEYQPRPQGGWPAQPAEAAGQGGYGQADQGYGRPPQAAPPGPSPRRRRRRRPLVWLVVVLIVILAVIGIGDQVAKGVAQNDIASQIQTPSGLSAKPSVSIEGLPFLTQVLAHDVKTINISANNVTSTGDKLPFSFTAKATGVHLNSSFNGATIDHIAGQVSISYQTLDTSLGSTIGIPGLSGITVTPDPGAGPNAVRANAGIGSVTATVTKTSANQLTVKFGSLGGLGSLLGGSGSIPDQVITVPKLPLGLVIGTPTVTSQGIVIPASASNTTLSQ